MLGTENAFFEADNIAQVQLSLRILALVIERISKATSAFKSIGMLGAQDLVLEVNNLLVLARCLGVFALPV